MPLAFVAGVGRGAILTAAVLACAGAGPTQPQTVTGPCQVKDFFIVSLGTSHTTMTVDRGAEACTFTLFNPDLQRFQTAAAITEPPGHGRAAAQLTDGGRMAAVSYLPQPGYTGPDRFTATIQPNDKAVIVEVVVR